MSIAISKHLQTDIVLIALCIIYKRMHKSTSFVPCVGMYAAMPSIIIRRQIVLFVNKRVYKYSRGSIKYIINDGLAFIIRLHLQSGLPIITVFRSKLFRNHASITKCAFNFISTMQYYCIYQSSICMLINKYIYLVRNNYEEKMRSTK